MAKREPNPPDDIKIAPENKQAEPVTEAPASEATAEEAAAFFPIPK